MIVFDLRCRGGGHVFEAWFASSDDYDAQAARGLVACPLCGDVEIEKALMAPRVGAKANASGESSSSGAITPSDAAGMKAMLAALARAQGKVLEKSTWVGRRFAEEARAIHHGEAEEKPIHGQATVAEARELARDGRRCRYPCARRAATIERWTIAGDGRFAARRYLRMNQSGER